LSLLLILLIMPLLSGNLAIVAQQYQATLTEWTLPTPNSGVRALTLDRSGSCCWFVEYYGNKLGHLDTTSNTFQEWVVPTDSANPYDLAVANNPVSPEFWGTEYASNRIFSFTPETSKFTEYPLPVWNSGAGYISIEPTGTTVRVWFTETTANGNGELIYDPTSANATLYEDHFPAQAGGGALGVYAESNSVWFAGFSALIKWDRTTQQYSIWPLPVHGAAIGRFITIDSYGQAWYTQGTQNATSSENFAGVLKSNGILEEWTLPSRGADPQKISINPQTLQPWIAERSLAAEAGAIAVLANSSEPRLVPVTSTTYPSGGTPYILPSTSKKAVPTTTLTPPITRTISGLSTGQFTEFLTATANPQDIVTDSRGNVWFSEPGTNRIAELSNFTPDFTFTTSPQAMSLPQGGSATVTLTALSISGYQGSITIGTSGLPNTLSASPKITLTIPTGAKNASSGIVLSIDPNATLGTSLITFGGSDGTHEHAASVLLTVTSKNATAPSKPQCLLAAATYGSDLSSGVNSLRGFRGSVLGTKIGRSFLTIFNSWYYSFSPRVASYASTHSNVREGVKGLMYPLIGSLMLVSAVYAALSFNPEFAVVLSGLLACVLIGSLYLAVPLLIIKRALRISLRSLNRLCLIATLGGLSGLLVGLRVGSNSLMMAASLVTVLSITLGAGVLTAEFVSTLKLSVPNWIALAQASQETRLKP